MDGNGFDELTRRLATSRSRRSVVRGLLGGGAALLTAGSGVRLTEAASKVTICHWSPDLGAYEQISVSQKAIPAHQGHQGGRDVIAPDFLGSTQTCGDCNTVCFAVDDCTPAACIGGTCNSTSACSGDQTCGGGGIAGQCGCTPVFAAEQCDGVSCGDIPDGCSGFVSCGCSDVDACTPAACNEGVCNATSSCGDDEICGVNGCEPIAHECADVQLAGYPDNTVANYVCVDDELDVFVNNQYVATAKGCSQPISLGQLQSGDTITLELTDEFPPCTIEPIRLICANTGAMLQALNETGLCMGPGCENGTDDWGGYGICYNPTFTVAI